MIKNKYETLIYIYECFQKLNCDYIHYINDENFDSDTKNIMNLNLIPMALN